MPRTWVPRAKKSTRKNLFQSVMSKLTPANLQQFMNLMNPYARGGRGLLDAEPGMGRDPVFPNRNFQWQHGGDAMREQLQNMMRDFEMSEWYPDKDPRPNHGWRWAQRFFRGKRVARDAMRTFTEIMTKTKRRKITRSGKANRSRFYVGKKRRRMSDYWVGRAPKKIHNKSYYG